MRILVTGGAGYIGSHTVRALQVAGHQPVVIDNLVYGHKHIVNEILNVPLVIGQIGDRELLHSVLWGNHKVLKNTVHENKMIEAVIHFAAYAYVGESVISPLKYYKNNVVETISLLESLCFKNKSLTKKNEPPIPIIFSSTCATYGVPDVIPIVETTKQSPINPYGHSKLFIEQIIKDLAVSYGLESVILRYFNAAGASPDSLIGENHNPETHLIPLLINAAIDNTRPVRVFGTDYDTPDGTCVRDYIHVCDLADAHVIALDYILKKRYLDLNSKNELCNVFNLGNGKGISVKEAISTVEKITNLKVPIIYDNRRAGDPSILIASAEKAKNILGWNPAFSNIEIIIKHAFEWHKKLQHKK
tara:strand:- start:1138 stop:2217 length:1080 start_codon:yes stop_codon:yes gene_type:complete